MSDSPIEASGRGLAARHLDTDLPLVCEHCGASEGVLWEDSRTAYHTPKVRDQPHSIWRQLLINVGCGDEFVDPEDEHRNRPQAYCRDCAEEHHAYWDDMWDEYYSGRGC